MLAHFRNYDKARGGGWALGGQPMDLEPCGLFGQGLPAPGVVGPHFSCVVYKRRPGRVTTEVTLRFTSDHELGWLLTSYVERKLSRDELDQLVRRR